MLASELGDVSVSCYVVPYQEAFKSQYTSLHLGTEGMFAHCWRGTFLRYNTWRETTDKLESDFL